MNLQKNLKENSLWFMLSSLEEQIKFISKYCTPFFNRLYWWYFFQRDNESVKNYRERYGEKAIWWGKFGHCLCPSGTWLLQKRQVRGWEAEQNFWWDFNRLTRLIDKILNFKQPISKCAKNTKKHKYNKQLTPRHIVEKSKQQNKSLTQPEEKKT